MSHVVSVYVDEYINHYHYKPWLLNFFRSLFPDRGRLYMIRLLAAPTTEARHVVGQELKKYNATWSPQFETLSFETEADYTFFLLKWL